MAEAPASHASVHELLERERRIGIRRTLMDLLAHESETCATNKFLVSLKTLYSDFVVREMAPTYGDGKPLELESLDASINASPSATTTPAPSLPSATTTPAPSSSSATTTTKKRERDDDSNNTAVDEDEVEQRIHAAFSSLVSAEELQTLVASLRRGEGRCALTATSKEARTSLHQAVRQALHGSHVSTTEAGVVWVVRATAADRRESQRRSNPIRRRPFLHFTLYKENVETNAALRSVAKHLGMSTRQLQFCGTKDKRAVTLQRVAIRDVAPARVLALNERSFGPRCVVKVCSLMELPEGLKLGDASGNHFTILLRLYPQTSSSSSSSLMDERLEKIACSLRAHGAINYFGPQRFGTTDILTSDVGLRLLHKDWEGAIQILLEAKSRIVPELAQAVRDVRDARDYDAALAHTPYFCFQERDVLQHLCRHPHDFQGALRCLPRTLVMLYFHAVQSLIFNHMASKRLSARERMCAEVGDLMLEEVYQQRLLLKDAHAILPTTTCSETTTTTTTSSSSGPLPAVRRLSAEDPLAYFDLSDVLLTLPGPDVELIYPDSVGCTLADYVEEMRVLNVAEELTNAEASASLVEAFHFHGTYRNLCIRPRDVAMEMKKASSWLAPVLTTDWERKNATTTTATATEVAHNTVDAPPTPVDALLISFSLPPGCYATCVLREFSCVCSESLHSSARPGQTTKEVGEEDGDADGGDDGAEMMAAEE